MIKMLINLKRYRLKHHQHPLRMQLAE